MTRRKVPIVLSTTDGCGPPSCSIWWCPLDVINLDYAQTLQCSRARAHKRSSTKHSSVEHLIAQLPGHSSAQALDSETYFLRKVPWALVYIQAACMYVWTSVWHCACKRILVIAQALPLWSDLKEHFASNRFRHSKNHTRSPFQAKR